MKPKGVCRPPFEDRWQKVSPALRICITNLCRPWEFQISRLISSVEEKFFYFLRGLHIMYRQPQTKNLNSRPGEALPYKDSVESVNMWGDWLRWLPLQRLKALMETIRHLMFLFCLHFHSSIHLQVCKKHKSDQAHIAHCKAFPANAGQPKHPVDPDPIWQLDGTPCKQTSRTLATLAHS